MTTLAQLAADVYSLTNRPDMVNETNLAIRSATLKAHQREFYFRDLFESGIQFSSAEFIQSFEPKTVFPLFRSIKYLRKYDSIGQTPGLLLSRITPDQVFDDYGIDYVNVYYSAGAEIQIKMNTQEQFMLFGGYSNPNVTIDMYSSWIADDYPFAVIYSAVAQVFKMLGSDTQANMYVALANDEFAVLDANNIIDTGF